MASFGIRSEEKDVLTYLRVVTRPAHLAIEGCLGLMEETLDSDSYRMALERLYGFWRVWEPQMMHLMNDAAFLSERRRQHLLADDLAGLGMTASTIHEIPRCPLTNLRSEMGALGSLYVMEGSTLGGRIILRNVERRLGSAARDSTSYFVGYGDQTGAMWRSFLARLAQAPVSSRQEIAQGALATFETLGAWLAAPADRFGALGIS